MRLNWMIVLITLLAGCNCCKSESDKRLSSNTVKDDSDKYISWEKIDEGSNGYEHLKISNTHASKSISCTISWKSSLGSGDVKDTNNIAAGTTRTSGSFQKSGNYTYKLTESHYD